MTHRLDVARGRDIVARWCALAEQRLEHLTELFESGRWRRYHSEVAFLENIQEAKSAVETWRDLLAYENSPKDFRRPISAWPPLPSRTHSEPVRSIASMLRHSHIADEMIDAAEAEQPASAPALMSPSFDLSILTPEDADTEQSVSREPDREQLHVPVFDVAALTLDFEAMKNRYPLLRNAL